MTIRTIVDTHFHIWEVKDVRPTGVLAAPGLRRNMRWSDYEEATMDLPVTQSIYVQVGTTVDEPQLRSISTLAAQQDRVACIIAFAPVESPFIAEHIDRLARFPLVKGVRRVTQDEGDPNFCATPEFVRGARLLGRCGLVLELLVRGSQLTGVVDLAAACPETTIVLNHLGKPNITSPGPGWYAGMAQLGKLPNVLCKLSVGLHTPHDPALDLTAMRPLVEHVIGSLGYQRVLFGSNWPVSTVVVTYRAWVAFLKRTLGGAGQSQLDYMFNQNARRTYGV